MTQTYRWLAALGLLVAFGACTVRAEEEQEETAPAPHRVAELPLALPSPAFPLLFAPPCPCPVPMPIPAGMYGLPSGPICLPCPLPFGCGPVQMCACAASEDAPEYVVTTRMVKGDGEVTVCPRVSVFEGQPATIHLQGYQTPQGRASLQMLASVTKQGKGARLALAVTEASVNDADETHLRSHTETTQAQCNVPFGKPYRMDLKAGACFMEVTVTEVEREERVHQAACGCAGGSCRAAKAHAEDESEASPLDVVGEVVDCVCDVLSDTANGALGWVFGSDDGEMEPTLQASLQAPAQVVIPAAACSVACEPATREPLKPCPSCRTASCPKSGCGCTPCAATEAAKKPTLRIRIDAKHAHTCVEVCGENKCWKASADQVTVTNGRLILVGDVHGESGDGSTEFTADRIERELDGLEIQVGD